MNNMKSKRILFTIAMLIIYEGLRYFPLIGISFRDYFSANAVCCIEWPERAPGYLALADVKFTLDLKGVGRKMQLSALSSTGAAVLSCLAGE